MHRNANLQHDHFPGRSGQTKLLQAWKRHGSWTSMGRGQQALNCILERRISHARHLSHFSEDPPLNLNLHIGALNSGVRSVGCGIRGWQVWQWSGEGARHSLTGQKESSGSVFSPLPNHSSKWWVTGVMYSLLGSPADAGHTELGLFSSTANSVKTGAGQLV